MKKIMKTRFIAAVFVLLNLTAFAQSLNDYLVTAGQNNPLLKARYQEYYAALEKVPQAGTLPDPQLSFSMFIGQNGLFMERLMGEQITELSVMQMFPWAGSLSTAKEEATYMAQMKFAALQEAKINLYHEVRSAWFKLYQVDEELKLLEEEKEILKTYGELALTRFKTGTSGNTPMNQKPVNSGSMTASGNSGMNMGGGTSQPAAMPQASPTLGGMSGGSTGSLVDVLLIQIQMKELDTRIDLLKASRKPLEVKFNNLLNREINSAIVVADTLTPAQLPASLSIIQDSIIQRHPMIRMYEWDEKTREVQQRMAVLMGRPMIGVGLAYMVFRPRMDELMNTTMGGDNMLMPMVTVTLPIYRKKYTAQRKEASFLQQTAKQNQEAVKLDLFNELERLLYDYESSTRRLNLYNDQLEITRQAIRLMITAYSTGTSGMEEILRQRQAILGYQQQQIATLTEQHTVVSSITRLMGTDNP